MNTKDDSREIMCAKCGRPYITYDLRRRYCSGVCATAARLEQERAYARRASAKEDSKKTT